MKAKTGTELTDIKELYDPQRVFQLSAQWRLAIISGWLKGKTKPLTNEEKTKLIEKQKCLDMVKEMLHAMGKICLTKTTSIMLFIKGLLSDLR